MHKWLSTRLSFRRISYIGTMNAPTWDLCNIRYPSKTVLKSHEGSFAHNLFCRCPIIWKFCTEHDNDADMICAKFQNYWTTEMDVMEEPNFARFEFNSLWPRDVIWRQESRLTLVQLMACCLTAPSHYLNQCWLVITKVQWCTSEGNFGWDITAISH